MKCSIITLAHEVIGELKDTPRADEKIFITEKVYKVVEVIHIIVDGQHLNNLAVVERLPVDLPFKVPT
jgi:hypothetical protein